MFVGPSVTVILCLHPSLSCAKFYTLRTNESDIECSHTTLNLTRLVRIYCDRSLRTSAFALALRRHLF